MCFYNYPCFSTLKRRDETVEPVTTVFWSVTKFDQEKRKQTENTMISLKFDAWAHVGPEQGFCLDSPSKFRAKLLLYKIFLHLHSKSWGWTGWRMHETAGNGGSEKNRDFEFGRTEFGQQETMIRRWGERWRVSQVFYPFCRRAGGKVLVQVGVTVNDLNDDPVFVRSFSSCFPFQLLSNMISEWRGWVYPKRRGLI